MYIDLPPNLYDHLYNGLVIEQILLAEEVEKFCNIKNAQACVLALPNFKGDKCFILLPIVGKGGVTKVTQDLLRRHEVAHCNGWKH